MLIRKPILERIRSGDVTLAFRRWRRQTVKTGSTLKTAMGILAIQVVEKTSMRDISEIDAHRAGYSEKDALIKDLSNREGDLYKITLAYAGEDPRIQLCADDTMRDSEFTEIREHLQRLDSASRVGSWTLPVLTAIQEHPMLPAAQLATHTGFEKEWLKQNVRKLKNLGLTMSHHLGYTLSPRGDAVLKRLTRHLPQPAAAGGVRGDADPDR